MSTRSGRRWLSVLAIGAAVAAAIGLGASPAMADEPIQTEAANAELLQPMCAVPSTHDPAVIATVHSVAKSRGVTAKVMLAAFEAGWVESHMNNLNCGDRDSLGVFQQRPSMGWCSPSSLCLNVTHATNKFLDQAIPNDRNNPGYTAGQLAQSVQRSAYPARYDQAESKARSLIAAAGGNPGNPSPSWPTLRNGSSGTDVRALQYLLTASGHSTGVDGAFGPATESAVRGFQSAKGLGVDGIVGPQTWSALAVTVRSGSSGSAVKALQTELNAHGSNLAVDGAFGPATKSAVTSFQRSHGLAVDGICGPQTWRAVIGA